MFPSVPRLAGIAWVLLAQLSLPAGQAGWLDINGDPLPWQRLEDVEAFLQSAVVESAEPIEGTAANPFKMVLVKDGIRVHAAFRHIDVFRQQAETPKGIRLNYRDSCQFEVAAYRLACLFSIDHIPPTVARHLGEDDFASRKVLSMLPSTDGTLQIWLEGTMRETDRVDRGLIPKRGMDWTQQFQIMWLFDNLIFNEDRNRGNILITPEWDLWFIDATRSFRPFRQLPYPEKVRLCERRVWEKLREVTDEAISGELHELLSSGELETLLVRRNELIELIRKLIRERGEDVVLFDRPGPASQD